MYKEYNNIFDVVNMFNDEIKVRDFFTYVCQAVSREAKRVDKDDEVKFYPVVYSEEHKTLSISFNFFVSCIATFYDAGNKSAETKINYELQIMKDNTSDNDETFRLHKNRTLVIVNILQDYYGILHPNSRRINVTKLTGTLSVKDSYFIPIIYEDSNKKAIQYEMIPFKLDRLFELDIEPYYVNALKEIGSKFNLKDVAFNQRNVLMYWQNNKNKRVLRYQN